MSTLLEITGDDIALLSDVDLRSLIGLLCEADFRLAGLPTNGIMWSGHQDAGDGGIDVAVQNEFDPPQNSLVPRRSTGFQVKKPDMPRSKTLEEMRPQGELREAIKWLIQQSGAYIIVSSASTTYKQLQNRIAAMREAIAGEPNRHQLHLDFLDRGSVATWVRTHPSLILWVRNKIGQPLQGWKSYDNWAHTPTGIQEEYIVGEELRLFDRTNSEQGDSVMAGLRKLRLRLSQSGASVRLTGLSGVGKTRLVQALFDDRVGERALNPSLAHYTDISDGPLPDPISFASQLVAIKAEAVLIIDNCSPELHRKLTKICAGSMVSLLTVEYDIRDDLPEETDVFRLEPSSDDLLEKLVQKRYPFISQINARTIAEFASGNARVAIALANTLKQNDSLSTLRDEDLFARLFHQRQNPNENLMTSAEICSLVYSFDGEDTSTTSELQFLADLAEKSVRELYRDVVELKKRGLVQARSIWRAVLPHAIANRLAKRALDATPPQMIVEAFLSSDSERLIKSFTRRLGYLHDSDPAIEIAKDWLKPDGWIGATNCNFNSLDLSVFENIAPVAPGSTLAMLERVADSSDGFERLCRHEFVRLLRYLAYDVDLFQRSARLLSRIALLEKPDTNDGGSARKTLSILFHIFLSGTHAPAQVRATTIEVLISSNVQPEQELGIELLEAALKTHHFWTSYTNTFGARPRDFGYRPQTNKEMVDWYRIFLATCTRVALLDAPIASKAKQVLANHLRGLWSLGKRFDQEFLEELKHAVVQIHNRENWNEAWIAVKGIIQYDGKVMNPEVISRLRELEEILRPVKLLDLARTYALTDGRLNYDLEDNFDADGDASEQRERVQNTTRQIGASVAQDESVLEELLPELTSKYHERLGVFGEGLAEGCDDRKRMWQILYQQIEKTPPKKRQVAVMLGFLSFCAINDSTLCHSILDSLLEDKLLGQWFPIFQMASAIDNRGVERLYKALDIGNAHIDSYKGLAWGRRHEKISDEDLAALIQKLLTKEGGLSITIEILNMRFHGKNDETTLYSQNLISVSREVLLHFTYGEGRNLNDHPDYRLAQIAGVSLHGEDGIQPTMELCQRLVEGFQGYRIHSFNYPRLLGKLAQIQPYIFLDSFVGQDEYMFRERTFGDLEKVDNPVNQIPADIIIDWCERLPEIRYPLMVSSMQMYSKPKDSKDLCWHPILLTIFEKAPSVHAVLSQLEKEIVPMSWSGSRADAMAKRLNLFTALYEHPNATVKEWAETQHQMLQVAVQVQREHEAKENRENYERFEE